MSGVLAEVLCGAACAAKFGQYGVAGCPDSGLKNYLVIAHCLPQYFMLLISDCDVLHSITRRVHRACALATSMVQLALSRYAQCVRVLTHASDDVVHALQVTSAGFGFGTFVLYGSTDCSGAGIFFIADNKCSGVVS